MGGEGKEGKGRPSGLPLHKISGYATAMKRRSVPSPKPTKQETGRARELNSS